MLVRPLGVPASMRRSSLLRDGYYDPDEGERQRPDEEPDRHPVAARGVLCFHSLLAQEVCQQPRTIFG
jgi:hypothetical protein